MVRQSSELETNIVAVERVQEYTKVQQEVGEQIQVQKNTILPLTRLINSQFPKWF